MTDDTKAVMVSKTRSVERQKVETVMEPVTAIEIVDGQPVQKTTVQAVGKPAFDMVAVLDADGQAVMTAEPIFDEEGEQTGTTHVPVMHPVPVMEMVQEAYEEPEAITVQVEQEYEEQEETTEEVEETYTEEVKTGEVRLGLRYDQCAVIEGAYQRRRADRLEARIAAIEAAFAA